MHKQLLIIGHTYPEPSTTAAGSRMMQLIDLFTAQGCTISFASTAGISERSEDLATANISTHAISLNDASLNVLLKEVVPDIVLFDRFVTEEQFGWRVTEVCPNAVQILDTEDLHFLRKAREKAFKKGIAVTEATLFTDTAKREIASILRCDMSLIISEIELELLTHTFKVPSGLLFYLPLVAAEISEDKIHALATFKNRQHFVALGNLKHAPNVASVQLLKQHIWPKLRQNLPQAELHIYGAYAPKQIQEMHSPKDGFLIMGWAPKISEVLENAKVQLAPLPFGAGLKGKLIDAMRYGLPTITTAIGAEGMFKDENAPGFIAYTWEAFIEEAIRLYTNEPIWVTAQDRGFNILKNRFQRSFFEVSFQKKIRHLLNTIHQHRRKHFIGQILQHQSLQATKYLSKWIEAKNSKDR